MHIKYKYDKLFLDALIIVFFSFHMLFFIFCIFYKGLFKKNPDVVFLKYMLSRQKLCVLPSDKSRWRQNSSLVAEMVPSSLTNPQRLKSKGWGSLEAEGWTRWPSYLLNSHHHWMLICPKPFQRELFRILSKVWHCHQSKCSSSCLTQTPLHWPEKHS